MRLLGLILVTSIMATGCFSPELELGPGDVVVVDDIVNGDIYCEGGKLTILSSATVNGEIIANGCALKMFTGNNGDITMNGGPIFYIEGAYANNGGLETTGVGAVHVSNSSFNGDGYIAGSVDVTVVGSSFNGDLDVINNVAVYAVENRANGDITIRGDSCVANGNDPNGSVSECR
jgi:hypothetical protein